MPSTFPEAFGMVAAEAAACGALPLSAGHSGMAEVTATLAPALARSTAAAAVVRAWARAPSEEIADQARDLARRWTRRTRDEARAALAVGGRPALLLGERGGGRDRGRPGRLDALSSAPAGSVPAP